MTIDTVIPLHPCKPNTKVDYHDGFKITATFNMDNRKWTWTATKKVTTTIEYTGEAKTIGYAMSAARRRIDNG